MTWIIADCEKMNFSKNNQSYRYPPLNVSKGTIQDFYDFTQAEFDGTKNFLNARGVSDIFSNLCI